MEQATLRTARLQLVPLAEEHLEYLVELDSDPEVMRYLAQGPSSRETTEQAHRDRLEQAHTMPRMGLWAGFTHEQFVGWWLLRPRSRRPGDTEIELGYRLLRRFWRQGLAGEGGRELIRHAFEDLGASQVYAETMAVNQASRATMTSVGLAYVRAFHGPRDPPDWEPSSATSSTPSPASGGSPSIAEAAEAHHPGSTWGPRYEPSGSRELSPGLDPGRPAARGEAGHDARTVGRRDVGQDAGARPAPGLGES